MSIKTTTTRHCDRCDRLTGNVSSPNPDADPPKEVVVSAMAGNGGEFQDLCSGCRRTVSNLLDRMFLRKKPEQAKAAK